MPINHTPNYTYTPADDAELRKFNFMLWRQTVSSQHSVHATVIGLSVTALTLFASFEKQLDGWQKFFFVATLILLSAQVTFLIFIADSRTREKGCIPR